MPTAQILRTVNSSKWRTHSMVPRRGLGLLLHSRLPLTPAARQLFSRAVRAADAAHRSIRYWRTAVVVTNRIAALKTEW